MSVTKEVADNFKKKAVVDVRSGDTVRVHQKIKEGNKERVQVFEGLVIRASNKNSHMASILVRRQSGSGVGVEKGYLLHSPLVTKVEILKRGKVRRNYLTYMRDLRGRAARLSGKDFDREAVNSIVDDEAEKAEAEVKAQKEAAAKAKAESAAKEQAALEAKQKAVEAAHKASEQ